MRTNRSVQSPVCSVISLIGFAPRLPVTVCHANTARGIRLAIKTPSLRSCCPLTICITILSILLHCHIDFDWSLLSPLPEGEGAKTVGAANGQMHVDVALEVLLQVHPGIDMGHLVSIAVKR